VLVEGNSEVQWWPIFCQRAYNSVPGGLPISGRLFVAEQYVRKISILSLPITFHEVGP